MYLAFDGWLCILDRPQLYEPLATPQSQQKNSVLLTKSSNPPFQYISCRCYERFEINVLYHDLQYFFQHNVPKIILKHEGNIM